MKQPTTYYFIIKNFIAYALSAVILRSLTAITSLLALRILLPEQFGILALANNFVAIAPLIFNLGLRQAFWLEYFHCTSQQRKELFNHAVATYLCIATPLLIIMLFNLDIINRYIFMGYATKPLLIIVIFYCFIHFFSELFLQILRNQMKATLLASIQLGAAVITITVYSILVFYAGWGIVGIMFANTLGITIIAMTGLYLYIRNNIYLHATTSNILANAKSLLTLGFPFIPSMILAWLLSASNRWLLAYLDTMQNVGIYSLADIVGQAFNLCILYPLSASYVPYMLQQYANRQQDIAIIERKNMQTMWWSMIGASLLITAGTIAVWAIAPFTLPATYQESVRYIWFIGITNVLFMGTYFTSCLTIFYKKTWLLLAMNTIAAILNVGLNIILIPWMHIYGCILASLCAYAVFFYLNWHVRRYLLKSIY